MSIIKEFKEFAVKGNVVDLAVGVIIGAAFGKIVSVLVNNVIMPPIGVLLGGTDFSSLAITIKQGVAGVSEPVLLKYGLFINALIDFLIIALVLFFFIKTINILKRTKEEAPPEAPAPTQQEILLTEIRDLLKK